MQITTEQRRARIGVRHALAPTARVATPAGAADAVVALHATDAATVFLSACARMREPGVTPVERALYEDVSLVKLLSMRRTLFAVSRELAPAVDAAAARAIAARERATFLKHLGGNGLDEAWLRRAEAAALTVLKDKGEATGSEISAAEPLLRTKITVFPGSRQETQQGVATRVLRMLACDGHIRRGHPRGSWTSSQFRWAPGEDFGGMEVAAAQAELTRRWLHAYGPATEADLVWWTGWTKTAARKALATTGAVAVELHEGTGYVLPGDTGPVTTPEPWAALLPALDPTPMGWKERGWYLDAGYRKALFDGSGNVGPTVWWNGEVVGAWAQRPDGEVVWRMLTDVGGDAERAVAAEAERVAAWIGDARITPRFRTPLEKELVA